MMSLSGLYLLFFAIAVGASAPTEASSAPAAVNPATASSPVTFALLADQHQQNNSIIPVQKESPPGPGDQKKIRLQNVLATAGTTAALLVLVFIFIKCAKQMKGFLAEEKEEKEKLRPEDVVDQPKKKPKKPKAPKAPKPKLTWEQELMVETQWLGSKIGFDDESQTEEEIRQEAKKRLEERVEAFWGQKSAAGSEGKTEDEIMEWVARDLERDIYKERAKRYGHKPMPYDEWVEQIFEPEWERRKGIAADLLRRASGIEAD